MLKNFLSIPLKGTFYIKEAVFKRPPMFGDTLATKTKQTENGPRYLFATKVGPTSYTIAGETVLGEQFIDPATDLLIVTMEEYAKLHGKEKVGMKPEPVAAKKVAKKAAKKTPAKKVTANKVAQQVEKNRAAKKAVAKKAVAKKAVAKKAVAKKAVAKKAVAKKAVAKKAVAKKAVAKKAPAKKLAKKAAKKSSKK